VFFCVVIFLRWGNELILGARARLAALHNATRHDAIAALKISDAFQQSLFVFRQSLVDRFGLILSFILRTVLGSQLIMLGRVCLFSLLFYISLFLFFALYKRQQLDENRAKKSILNVG